ncbi:hypothetical protein AB0C29_41580 [Actinoplanes sp. NPDC048791]|uniref:hypothetical protein n=1 Tax=Actinoplanes sp. NPDC048791 TaxID=3154623 RepID=UPI00340C214F
MTANHTIARERLVTALDVLRGRPMRVDYGLLLVLPFVAAAGGVLISLLIEDAVERRRARGFIPDGRGAGRRAGES